MGSSYKVQPGEPQMVVVGSGSEARRIAVLRGSPRAPEKSSIFWLSGFMSDMASTKATAVAEWAAERGLASTRFDYSGHGRSELAMEDGTIGRWLDEAETIFTSHTEGPQVVIGSSMGGYLALLLLKRLMETRPAEAQRIRALLLIAPAWDMTEELMWEKFPVDARQAIQDQGFFLQPSAYASPYVITRKLIEDGRDHLLGRKPFDPRRPVVILQGLLDPDVPVAHTRELLTFLKGPDVKLVEIADGEHRLSRPQDLALLFSELEKLI